MTPEQHLVPICSYLWTYLELYTTAIIAEFEQINVIWVWETIVSDNKFAARTKRNILSYGHGKPVCCVHPCSPKIRL